MRHVTVQRLADEDLMPLLERKDPRALEVVFDRHGGSAFSLAYRIVGSRPAAEDVVQEAFLSIWRSKARYDRARGSVRNWLLGIVRNRAIDLLRRDAGRPVELHAEDILHAREAEERTEVEALRRETAGELRRAVDDLPGEQLRVIELAYYGGYTHSEIAEILGMPLGTVKGRMRRGIERIRSELTEGIL